MQGGIFIVIYADVLFIVNFFITFLLLQITAKLGKRNPKTIRFVFASALGGGYSLIILADNLPFYLSAISKAVSAMLLVLITFGFKNLKSFASLFFIFLFSSFVFLGIIAGIQMIFASDRISINNGEIYFDINAKQLLFTALFSYICSCVVIRLYNKKLAYGEVYNIVIKNNEKEVSLFALCDTGNKLKEPFSGYPVVIVRAELVCDLFDENKVRLIPATTVNSSSYLKAFKPEYIRVKTKKGYEKIENVYIALSDDLNSKDFSAVINPEILSL